MAVGAGYLTKIVRALRTTAGTDVNAELTDIIEECRLDLQQLGVLTSKTVDETDSLILGAVRAFARWKFGLQNPDADRMREDYLMMRDELRRRVDYTAYAITFAVTLSGSAVDATVTFNGETKETGSTGIVVFKGVNAGANQEYTVSYGSYSTTAEIDVTATATITVSLG